MSITQTYHRAETAQLRNAGKEIPMGHYLDTLDELKRQLTERHPRWQIWFVPRTGQPAVWCARPLPQLQAESAEQLSEAIAQAEAHLLAGAIEPRQTSPASDGTTMTPERR